MDLEAAADGLFRGMACSAATFRRNRTSGNRPETGANVGVCRNRTAEHAFCSACFQPLGWNTEQEGERGVDHELG